MVIYEPITGNSTLNNIQDYPALIKFINNGGVVIKEKITVRTGRRIKIVDGKDEN